VIEAITERSRNPEELLDLLKTDALERHLISEKNLKSLEVETDAAV